MVILRFHSYRAYFWRKWLSVGLIALTLVAVQSAAIGLSGLGLPLENQWELPAGAVDSELFAMFKLYFLPLFRPSSSARSISSAAAGSYWGYACGSAILADENGRSG